MPFQVKHRVLIVDDSATFRAFVVDGFRREPCLEVIGEANDPYEAREKILTLNPDVIAMDWDMPRMDGISFLKILMQHRPLPTVVMSGIFREHPGKAREAIEAGAVDVLAKPNHAGLREPFIRELSEKLQAAARIRMEGLHARGDSRGIRQQPGRVQMPRPQVMAHPPAAQMSHQTPTTSVRAPERSYDPRQIILIGSSTGGTEALDSLLSKLPANMPPICVAQHISARFSKAFAERLARNSRLQVREATHGEEVKPGVVLIAPGDYHMELHRAQVGYQVFLQQGAPLHHQRPAVDVLFRSAAEIAADYAVSVILTGMGRDGADGMKALKLKGARTVVQDEASCVVYGMPKAAVELGVVDHIVSLDKMPAFLVDLAGKARSRPTPLSI